jgi:hypothetical protein
MDLTLKTEVKAAFTRMVQSGPYIQVLDRRLKIEGLFRNVCSSEVPSVFFDILDSLLVAPPRP